MRYSSARDNGLPLLLVASSQALRNFWIEMKKGLRLENRPCVHAQLRQLGIRVVRDRQKSQSQACSIVGGRFGRIQD
jgi:hypothetical protein